MSLRMSQTSHPDFQEKASNDDFKDEKTFCYVPRRFILISLVVLLICVCYFIRVLLRCVTLFSRTELLFAHNQCRDSPFVHGIWLASRDPRTHVIIFLLGLYCDTNSWRVACQEIWWQGNRRKIIFYVSNNNFHWSILDCFWRRNVCSCLIYWVASVCCVQ